MEIKASSKYLRISPKKLRQVVDLIRKKKLTIEETEAQLKFIRKRASEFILKTLHSAISNAKHNFGIDKKNLFIKNIIVNQGPTLKRWRAKAFGRAAPIRKRSSHLEIILETFKPPERKQREAEKISEEHLSEKDIKEEPKKKVEGYEKVKKSKRQIKQHLEKTKMKPKGSLIKKVFRRKAI